MPSRRQPRTTLPLIASHTWTAVIPQFRPLPVLVEHMLTSADPAKAAKAASRRKPALLRSLLAVAANPDVHELAGLMSAGGPGEPGRPSLFPDWVFVVVLATATFYGSPGGVINELQDPVVWRLVVDAAATSADAEEVEGLDEPPDRHHWGHWIKRHDAFIADEAGPWQVRFRQQAARQAVEQGLLVSGRGHRSPRLSQNPA